MSIIIDIRAEYAEIGGGFAPDHFTRFSVSER